MKKKKRINKSRKSFAIIIATIPLAAILIYGFQMRMKFLPQVYLFLTHVHGVASDTPHSTLTPENLLYAVNQARAQKSLPSLTLNSKLNVSAEKSYKDMQANHCWWAIGPDGKTIYQKFLTDSGYQVAYSTEFLSSNLDNPFNIVDSWYIFPSDKNQLFSSRYDEMGVYIQNNHSNDAVIIFASNKFLTLEEFNTGINPISRTSIEKCISAPLQSIANWQNYPHKSDPRYIKMIDLYNQTHDKCQTILTNVDNRGYVAAEDVSIWNEVDKSSEEAFNINNRLNSEAK